MIRRLVLVTIPPLAFALIVAWVAQ